MTNLQTAFYKPLNTNTELLTRLPTTTNETGQNTATKPNDNYATNLQTAFYKPWNTNTELLTSLPTTTNKTGHNTATKPNDNYATHLQTAFYRPWNTNTELLTSLPTMTNKTEQITATKANDNYATKLQTAFYRPWNTNTKLLISLSTTTNETRQNTTTYPTTEQTLDYSTLFAMRQKCKSPGAFAIALSKKLFKEEELINRNVYGGKEKEPLDKTRVWTIKTYLSAFFTPEEVQKGINGINSDLRKYVNAR